MDKRKPASAAAVSAKLIERSILVVRGQRVLLDGDLATLYGVTTGALNQAIKRNSERFPEDFAFQLTESEFINLKSQIVTSRWGGRRKSPWAFTEHGVAMLSSVLRSPTAARVNIEIMRAFVRLRRLLATPGELVQQITKLAETVELHDGQIKAIADVLRQMMAAPPKVKEIGFHTLRTGTDDENMQ
jgi:ORF6N domain